ncbi:MAG: hypothetical protein AAF525_19500 [Pseudomonadota bacterium]
MSTARWMSRIAVAFAMGCLLVACGEQGEILKDYAVGDKSEEEVTFLNDRFGVLKPEGWVIMDDLHDGAAIGMGNPLREAYMVSITESAEDFDAMTVEEHSELTRQSISESLQNYAEDGPYEVTTASGVRGVSYQLTGSFERINIVYNHVTLGTEDHFHQVLLWSIKSRYASNEADFDRVVESFNEKYITLRE